VTARRPSTASLRAVRGPARWALLCPLAGALPLLALVPSASPTAAGEQAARVFVNARVWTGDSRHPRAQALAVAGDRLLAVGSDAEARALAGPATEILDLGGRRVVPGFNDAHLHFLVLDQADVTDVADVAELQERVRAYAAAHPAAAWIRGRGWGYAAFPDRMPHRRYLDAVVADRPVLLSERDGHMALVNTRALELAGITRETPDPEHGVIERDAAGDPTGELKESAMGLVRRHMPDPSSEELYAALKLRMDQAASYGLTSVQNASPIELEVYERLLAEGGFKVRVYAALPFEKTPSAEKLARARALREKYPGPLLKFGSVKGMLDGVVDAKTAAMLEPYVGGGTGIPMWTQQELDAAAEVYDREGFQILLHAIGDKAIAMALDAYAHAARVNGTSGRRHRVEHVEVPRAQDLPRFRALGVIASTQALFANPDATTLGNYAVLLGPERAARANAFKRLDDAGAVQAFGSDWPVFSMEALRGVYCAVARQTAEGGPSGGWYPENRISVEAALAHFTRDAAYASFDEGEKGTLAAGKLADFVVLSDDILQEPPERILRAKVLLTVMGGRDTWRAPDFGTAKAGSAETARLPTGWGRE
jgi:predicted amidohydrolase YtcJ